MKNKVKYLVGVIVLCCLGLILYSYSYQNSQASKLELAYKYLNDECYEEAILAFDLLLDIDPNNNKAHLGKTLAHASLQLKEEGHLDIQNINFLKSIILQEDFILTFQSYISNKRLPLMIYLEQQTQNDESKPSGVTPDTKSIESKQKAIPQESALSEDTSQEGTEQDNSNTDIAETTKELTNNSPEETQTEEIGTQVEDEVIENSEGSNQENNEVRGNIEEDSQEQKQDSEVTVETEDEADEEEINEEISVQIEPKSIEDSIIPSIGANGTLITKVIAPIAGYNDGVVKYISVVGKGSPWSKEKAEGEINATYENNWFSDYNEAGYISAEVYKNVLVLLFNESKESLGYYFYNYAEDRNGVFFYDNNKIENAKPLRIDEAISFEIVSDTMLRTKILAPIAGYEDGTVKYISITGSDSPWTEEKAEVHRKITLEKNRLSLYDEKGNLSGEVYKNVLVLLFNQSKQTLGYRYFNNVEVKNGKFFHNNKSVTPTDIEEISKKCIDISKNERGNMKVKIDRQLLPSHMSGFTHITVVGMDLPWSTGDLDRMINNAVVKQQGYSVYKEDGYQSVAVYPNIGILIFKDDKCLGYYFYNNVDPNDIKTSSW